jgi:hypothetical protein
MTVIAHRRVAPFGHPRIAGCVLLPLAYRSLPRPSSPSCAQASPTCFRSLDHTNRVQAEHARSTMCSTYSTSRVGFVSHDHYRRTVVKQQKKSGLRPNNQKSKSRLGNVSRRRLREDFPSASLTKCALTRRSVKEVIQPQVPLRLPCYDFAPVTTLAFGSLAPCGFRH